MVVLAQIPAPMAAGGGSTRYATLCATPGSVPCEHHLGECRRAKRHRGSACGLFGCCSVGCSPASSGLLRLQPQCWLDLHLRRSGFWTTGCSTGIECGLPSWRPREKANPFASSLEALTPGGWTRRSSGLSMRLSNKNSISRIQRSLCGRLTRFKYSCAIQTTWIWPLLPRSVDVRGGHSTTWKRTPTTAR